MNIAPLAVAVQDIAKEDCAAVAKLGNEIAELMRGVGHRDRLGARRDDVAGKHRRQLIRFQTFCMDAQLQASDLSSLIKCRFCDRVGESRAKKCSGRRA